MMAYEGDILLYCPGDISFSMVQAVVVSGASWNPCGHMIFCAGVSSDTSWYFHVAGAGWREGFGAYAYPKFMREEGYNRYLAENGKKEIRRLDAKISNSAGAYQKLTTLMADKWFWAVLPHNCASFAKEIVSAGGGDLTVLLNCPDQETVRIIGQTITDWSEQLRQQGPGPKW